jgi:hypothetical protein
MAHMRALAIAASAFLCGAAQPPVSFAPKDPSFTEAAQSYHRIWVAEGPRVVHAMEAATGLTFPPAPVNVVVYEGVSWSGTGQEPMFLRASYSDDVKKGTIVHELGHRLIARLPRDPGMDEHRTLFLFLYDVWTDLYGRDFADRMVTVERARKGLYDYDAAWTWALALPRSERQARFRALVQRMRALPATSS